MGTVTDNIILPWQHRVCVQCLKQNPHAVWLVKYKCLERNKTHKGNTALVVIDHERMALTQIRPPPETFHHFRGRFYMCRHGSYCPSGDGCNFAHSRFELDNWNTLKTIVEAYPSLHQELTACDIPTQAPSDICEECFSANHGAVWLSWLTCTDRSHGENRVRVIMSRDRNSLVKVREHGDDLCELQPNQLKVCHYKDACEVAEACKFAHSEEELDYWRWKVATVRTSAELSMFMLGDSTYEDLCERYSYPGETSDVVLNGVKHRQLTCANYKGKYHKLVYLDDLEHARKMVSDCDGEVTIDNSHDRGHLNEAEVHVIGMQNGSTAIDYVLQNIPPCKVEITLTINGREKRLTGLVSRRTDNTLIVELDKKNAHLKLPQTARVHFEYSHWYFWRLHYAIDQAPAPLIKRLVVPSESRYLPQASRTAERRKIAKFELDEEYQTIALRKMLLCRPGSPFLLLGPFGTGKTHLLAAAVIKLLNVRESKILICTHQNKGADHLFSTLCSRKEVSLEAVVRLYPNDADAGRSRFPGHSASVNDIGMHYDQVKVIITTFMTALRLKEKDRGRIPFTHIIMDEGAQSREPEALGALLMSGQDTHIIIAGDHKQVGPGVAVLNDVARGSGLGESLLERLLSLYTVTREYRDSDNKLLNFHRHSLLTNYRCHPSILMLASSLFYECTLLGRSESKVHPKAPFPLVFECSSIKQGSYKVSSADNRREAEILVRKALEFVTTWPQVRSRVKPRIAILAGSGRQVDCLRSQYQRECTKQKLKSGELLCDVEITRTYTIQGDEFDAVFLSTHESTDKDGKPCNTVRSICNEYVFNTVITRSRSLLFAVGNPFLLHRMGSHSKINCWAEYIQRCIVCQSFHLLEAPETKEEDLPRMMSTLAKQVLPRQLLEEIDDTDDVEQVDRVIEGYMRLLNSKSERAYGMKLVQDPKKGKKYRQSDTEKNKPSGKNVLAELKLSSHRKGRLDLQDHEAPALKVSSLRDRRCAFPGDVVPVDVRNKQIVLNDDSERRFNETHFGTSIFCRVNPHYMIEFFPLDDRYPVLVNLPPFTKQDKDGVTCFEPSTINDRLKVNNFIPKQCAVKMVFVVKVLKWTIKHHHPLGIVIGALPCGNSVYFGDLLLKVTNNVCITERWPAINDPDFASETADPDFGSETAEAHFSDVITIDPQGSTDHDDALSCVQNSFTGNLHEYEIGVHITDVQKFVPEDSELDRIARKRGCSVYSSTDECVSHMLPEAIVAAASIQPQVRRDAFSVVARVIVRNGSVYRGPHSVTILKSQITSTQELTYEEAQVSLYAKKGGRRIKTLWLVACHLRQQRLGEAAHHLSVSGLDEVLNPEAHLLVEEMMIWANQEVAAKLLEEFPLIVILRRQPKPIEQELEELIETKGKLLAVSLDLKQHVPPKNSSYGSVQVLQETVVKMLTELEKGSVRKALHLVQFEHLQPQVAVAHALFNKIRQRSSYCIPGSLTDDEVYSHDSLNCEQYTRFTSPIRRFIDLVIQRMLLASLQNKESSYEEKIEDLEEICKEIKEREKKADRYEKDRKKLDLACDLRQSSREYLSFVKEIKEGKLSLTFSDPALEAVNNESRIVHLKHLNATSIPHQRETSPMPEGSVASDDTTIAKVCTWKVKFASAKGGPGRFLSNPHLQHVVSNRSSAAAQATISFFTPDKPEETVACSDLAEQKVAAAIKPFSHSIPKANWRQLQRCLDQPVSPDSVKKLLAVPARESSTSHFPGIPASPLWIYKLHRPLETAEVLKVQLSASLSSRSQIVSPNVQLLEVGPNLRVCIQHSNNPTECFTDTSLAKPPEEGFSTLNNYYHYWERVLLAEAATASLTDTELLIITDVDIEWPSLLKIIDSQGQVYYQLPMATKVVESICACMKLSKSFGESSYDFFTFNPGDFVCIRCEGEVGRIVVKSVLHMVVHSVEKLEKTDEGYNVFLKFVCEKSNYISQLTESAIRGGSISYEVQLIPLTLPFRRIYKNLKMLSSKDPKTLSSIVALSKVTYIKQDNLPEINKVLPGEQYKVATTLWNKEECSNPSAVKLNKFQIDAIRLACSKDFVMIQGPPGTGKSVTGAHIAYALAMKLRGELGDTRRKNKVDLNPCVMYCGPSQQSVNVVLDILTSSVEVQASNLKIVRVYSKAIARKDFPGPMFHTEVFRAAKTDGQCDPKFADYALHHLIRKANPEICSLDREFAELQKKNKIPSYQKRSSYSKLVTHTSIDVLKDDIDIVLCTCNEASSHRIINSIDPVYSIIDECAMATEPECMVPIRRADHVVLIGDHNQLQPVLGNRDAMKMGMGTSLFGRYVKSDAPIHMLEIQYRMHEALCSFPSSEFYEDRLKTDPSVAVKYRQLLDRLNEFWPGGRDKPLLFCNVVGEEEENHTGQRGTARVGLESKRNCEEAKKIVDIAEHLLSNYHVNPEEIAVITPYSAQKEEIKTKLKKRGVDGIAVKTITESQGSEFGIVLLSTVRSRDLKEMTTADGERRETDSGWRREVLGFITDRHQICVGITRCKYGLLIVGNKMLLSYDSTWEALIDHCEVQGCMVDGENFPGTPCQDD